MRKKMPRNFARIIAMHGAAMCAAVYRMNERHGLGANTISLELGGYRPEKLRRADGWRYSVREYPVQTVDAMIDAGRYLDKVERCVPDAQHLHEPVQSPVSGTGYAVCSCGARLLMQDRQMLLPWRV